MKKFSALLVALIMTLSLAACGEGGGGTKQETLIDWINGGTYSFEYTMTEDGITIDGVVAAEKDKFAMTMNAENYGESMAMRIVVTEDYAYMIFEDEQFYMDIPLDEVNEAVGGLMDVFGGIGEPVESGTDEINGKSLPFEKYLSADGSVSTFYFEDGQVYAVEVDIDGEAAVMFISNAKKTASASIFAPPPDDFMSFADMMAAMWG
jgi:hypothetical protein